jgi:hypothetical protein
MTFSNRIRNTESRIRERLRVDTSASAVGIGNCPTNDANLGRVVEERWGETRLRQAYVAAKL